MENQALELPFVASVPRGHEILVAWLSHSPDAKDETALVLDRTAGILYCDPSLWGPLGRDPRVLQDPIAVLTRWTWTVTRSITGIAAGAVVVTTSRGDSNDARTRLFVQGLAAPYRS
ncbi:Hypothetical protein A7982_06055 [Minicystis rosea]|nr:Hypothetical protein A7982_06055 [Minicystis rosea]